MTDYRLPLGTTIEGPQQVFARINQNPDISRDKTLLGQRGSSFVQGNLLVIPVETSILYVQPIYVESAREGTQLPQFYKVVVVYGERVETGATIDEALKKIFGTAPPSLVGERPETTTGTVPSSVTSTAQPSTLSPEVQTLLDQAQSEFNQADAALKSGVVAEYQRHINAARDALAQAQSAARGQLNELTATVGKTPGPSPPP